MLRDFGGELGVFGRIDIEHTGTEDGEGAPAGFEGSTMSLAINSSREPADNREARFGEARGDGTGVFFAVARAVACSDHGDRKFIFGNELSLKEEDAGRVGEFEELAGIAFTALAEDSDLLFLTKGPNELGFFDVGLVADGGGDFGADAFDRFECAARCSEDFFGSLEASNEPCTGDGADAAREMEPQVSEGVAVGCRSGNGCRGGGLGHGNRVGYWVGRLPIDLQAYWVVRCLSTIGRRTGSRLLSHVAPWRIILMSRLRRISRRRFVSNASSMAAVGVLSSAYALGNDSSTWPGEVSREFIYEKAPFPECHASTIVETPKGFVCAWFGGTEEKHPDVGIWISHRVGDRWTAPVEVVNGVWSDGKRYPTWNPVLFQYPGGPLALFYKVGPDPSSWWGMQMFSEDHGKTWSKGEKLPEGIIGPVRNKPVLVSDGSLLCGSSTEHDGWRLQMERTMDRGKTWERIAPETIHSGVEAIQPTILRLGGEKLVILNRARKAGKVLASSSSDNGKTWSKLAPISLPNNNSGIDGVTTKNGKHYLVYNHTPKGRTPLCVAMSEDAETWRPVYVLENVAGEYSYPAIIEGSDGLLHITYTWRREKISHVVLDPAKLKPGEYQKDGGWPA